MTERLDYCGLRCPQPVIKAAMALQKYPKGTTVEVFADCPEFPAAVKQWCEKNNRVLINLVSRDGIHNATIRS